MVNALSLRVDLSSGEDIPGGTISGTFGPGEHSIGDISINVEYIGGGGGGGGGEGGDDGDDDDGGGSGGDPVPDVLRILNCFINLDPVNGPHPEMPGRPWELWYTTRALEGIDPCDVAFEYIRGFRLRTTTVVDGLILQRDARPKDHQGPIFLDLSWVSDADRPAGYEVIQLNATNYLKVSMPSTAKFGQGKSLVTLQQVSTQRGMTYPIFDLRKVIENGSMDEVSSSINYRQKVGIVPLADMFRKIVRLEEPYAALELRTDKVSIVDYDDNKIVDANDYAIWLRDYGKTGNSASDIASLKDSKIILGIPDGRVDQNDLVAFEQEASRFTGPSVPFADGFEHPLGPAWSFTGDLPWEITTDQSHSGNQCIRAGDIDGTQTSGLVLQRECAKGTVRFWRRISTEDGCDMYRFFINGTPQEELSGEVGWEQVSYRIVRLGINTFEWRYEKDLSVSNGADTVWIDDVEIITE